ncbi:MAG: hypothetical protein DRJ01_01885 [Bacteroidetes bacterium]|nr:MAG: hypothetical protein DRJ01_01885 [Bacteroidota bacterium]
MLKTIKIFLSISLLFAGINLFSQNSTSSPYSQFGIGDIVNKGFGQNYAMGGTGIGMRSSTNQNNINPASLSALKIQRFKFQIGIKNQTTKFKSSNAESTSNDINLDYLSMWFRVSNWWHSSFSLNPYSNVGYNIVDSQNYPSIGNVETYFVGSGGINQFNWSNSFQFFKHFSVGINASYLLGSLNQTRTVIFVDDSYTTNTQSEKNINISDVFFNYGIQYYNKLNENYSYTLGLKFDNETKINVEKSILSGSTYGKYTNSIYDNTLIDTLENIKDQKDSFTIPTNLGFGFSFSKNQKFIISADYTTQNWSSTKFLGRTDSLTNSNSFKFGLEYTPKWNSINHAYKRFHYRFGGHYTNTYLNIYNEQLKDYGISFGLGIPLRKTNTLINLSFELGQRGTIDNNLIKENYGIIRLNLSLSDIWFIKRKFD